MRVYYRSERALLRRLIRDRSHSVARIIMPVWRDAQQRRKQAARVARAKLAGVSKPEEHRGGCASQTGLHACNCVVASHERMRAEIKKARQRRRRWS